MQHCKQVAYVLLAAVLVLPSSALAGERGGQMRFSIKLPVPDGTKKARLWLPFPETDNNQKIADVTVNGNYTVFGFHRDSVYGNRMLYAEWDGTAGDKLLTFAFSVKRAEVSQDAKADLSPDDRRRNLDLSCLGSALAATRELAQSIVLGKKTDSEKARAIYDWVVENMYRDASVKGCGLGDVKSLLQKKGGKCVDIHSVYVALNRAAGIPAREIYGIRMPKTAEGDVSKAQHCWAEIYLNGIGWRVADPADVRKIILEQKLTLDQAAKWREYYWGRIDEYRIAYGTGKNIMLNPAQSAEPLAYFGYPYAEADGKPLNEDLFGFNLGYTMTFSAK